MMICRLTIEVFGPNIQYITEVDNMLNDTLIRIPTYTDIQADTITLSGLYICRDQIYVIG